MEEQAANYEFWKKRFPQIRLSILNEVVEELEICFNQALGQMGLLDWSIAISTEKQLKDESTKPELTIKLVADGQELDLDNLSGGERQRLKVCTSIGISDLIMNRCGVLWNMRLLDEPCASLSQEGIENLLELLSNLGETMITCLAEHRVLE